MNVVESLNSPVKGRVGGLSVDALGYIYSADFEESLRRIDPDGESELFARGFYGASGNTVLSDGSLVQASFHGDRLHMIGRTGAIETIPVDGLSGPVGVMPDPGGGLWVANFRSNSIMFLDDHGEKRVIQDDLFNGPNGICMDRDGNVVVANYRDGRILLVGESGHVEVFVEVPGGGNGHVCSLDGRLFATAFRAHQIFEITDGALELLAGTGTQGDEDGPSLESHLSFPNGLAPSPTGDALFFNEFIGRTPFDNPRQTRVRRLRFSG